MDAFGIASGLVAIHTRRQRQQLSGVRAARQPRQPLLRGLLEGERPARGRSRHDRSCDGRQGRGRSRLQEHCGVGAARRGADRHQERQLGDREIPRQLGRQSRRLVAHAGVRRVGHGGSAHGQRANPRAAQSVHRQSAAAAVSLHQRGSGAGARGQGASSRRSAPSCHTPGNKTIYPVAKLGVDANRTLVNTSVSRYGLAALVVEACSIYGLNHQGQPGADWCRPKGDWQARLDEYFRDTPRRVVEGTNGYKADMLRGIWAQAPYLHNGSVPTIGQLMCPSTRPVRFLRGNVHYDEALVGFEWLDSPAARYAPERFDPHQGVRHDGPGEGQHRTYLRRRPLPGYDRPRSDRRSQGDRETNPGLAKSARCWRILKTL